ANDKYYGLIEAENALAKSLNIPFIYMLKDFGDDKFFFFLKRVLKFHDNNYLRYGLSLILGTKEFSMEDVGILYSGLANYGNFRKLKYLRNEEKIYGEKIISEDYLSDGASYLTLKTLAKVERPGIEKLYMSRKNISWKTGTSEGQKDAWACGVTPEWTVIVWVGNFTGESNPNLSGIETAGSLLFNIFNRIDRNPQNFSPPSYDLEEIKVDRETGYSLDYNLPYKKIQFPIKSLPLRASPFYKKIFVNPDTGDEIDSRDASFTKRQEKISLNYPIELINFFVRDGKDISKFYNSKNKVKSLKILYPSNKLKIKVPKDFDGEQKLIVKIANIKNKNLYWYLDKNYLGTNKDKEKAFSLKRGKYILTVITEDMEIEKVQFEIVQ
ncbi:MAG: penicillin-binding protein 1C, partial [Fusobacteriaceae bacterium]